MALCWYDPQVALDPTTRLPVPGGVGQVYAWADTTHTTPLTVTLESGATTTTVTAGPLGILPAFAVDGHLRIRWYVGGIDITLRSYDGIEDRLTTLDAEVAALRALLESGGGGGGGGGGGVSLHAALSGLAADDHAQYHNDTRGDVRYYTKAQVTSLLQEFYDDAVAAARERGNHTGLDQISSIQGLQAALNAKASVLVVSSVEEVPAGTPVNTLIVVPMVTAFGPAPSVIGSDTTSSSASGATLVVDIPTTGTPTSGDLIVVALTSMSSAIAQAWTPPDGTWTLLSPTLVDLGSGQNSNTRVSAVYAKRLSGAPASSYTFTSPGSDSQRRIAAVAVVRGVDPIAPVASTSSIIGVNGAGTTDITIPALSAARPRTLQLVWAWSNGTSTDDFATLPAPSPSLTSRASETLPPTGSVSKTQLVEWSRENSAAGPLSAVTLDFTARAHRAGISVVLNPAVV